MNLKTLKSISLYLFLFFNLAHAETIVALRSQYHDLVCTTFTPEYTSAIACHNTLLDIFTSLKLIRISPQEQLDEYEQEKEHCIDEILDILVAMYEKIISSTVTYYLLFNFPNQTNLAKEIAQIMVQHCMKILGVLSKHVLYIFHTTSLSWQKKMQYCITAFCLSFCIKFLIDTYVPYTDEKKLDTIIVEKSNAESSYVSDKFSNWL